jgi:hypothetical protein
MGNIPNDVGNDFQYLDWQSRHALGQQEAKEA